MDHSGTTQMKRLQDAVDTRDNGWSRSVVESPLGPPSPCLLFLAKEPQKDRIFFSVSVLQLEFFLSSESSNRATRVCHGVDLEPEVLRSPSDALIGLAPVRRGIWTGRRVGEQRRPPCLGPGSRMRWRCRGGLTTGAGFIPYGFPFPQRCMVSSEF